MDLLYSVFFGAGTAALVYAKFGRRIGYGNSSSVWVTVGISFVIGFFVFYTVARFFLPAH